MYGFVIAGVSSGIGKTTVSMGLMSLFENVSPFKVGPDYIDPTFHQFVTHNKSYNLDTFLMGEDGVKYSFYKHTKDISIVEGVMGLYDGINHTLNNNSTAHISRILELPVILVVDGGGKSTSIAAQILGYKLFDERVNIAGVIINKTSEAMYQHYKEAIEKFTNISCLGYVPKNDNLNLNSRHLGLLQATEIDGLREKIDNLKEILKSTLDIKKIKEIANLGKREIDLNKLLYKLDFSDYKDNYKGKKIGIAKDNAFSFYYNDNIEVLEYLGYEIEYFSPIDDNKIPNVDILYFGGGYPELYCKELSKNQNIIKSIREFYNKNGNIYGECGGFMYLSQIDKTKLCDIIKVDTVMTNRLNISRFGYIDVCTDKKVVAKAHEFHYSKLGEIKEDTRKFLAKKPNKNREWKTIFNQKRLYAGYPHIHFYKSFEFLKEILKEN